MRRTGVVQGGQLEDYHYNLDEQYRGPVVRGKADECEGPIEREREMRSGDWLGERHEQKR